MWSLLTLPTINRQSHQLSFFCPYCYLFSNNNKKYFPFWGPPPELTAAVGIDEADRACSGIEGKGLDWSNLLLTFRCHYFLILSFHIYSCLLFPVSSLIDQRKIFFFFFTFSLIARLTEKHWVQNLRVLEQTRVGSWAGSGCLKPSLGGKRSSRFGKLWAPAHRALSLLLCSSYWGATLDPFDSLSYQF